MKIELINTIPNNLPVAQGLSAQDNTIALPQTANMIEAYKKSKKDACQAGNYNTFIYEQNGTQQELFIFGLDTEGACCSESFRTTAGNLIRTLKKQAYKEIVLALPAPLFVATEDYLGSFAQGLALGNYTFDNLKTTAKPSTLETVYIYCPRLSESLQSSVQQALLLADNIMLTRDLTNLPANLLAPHDMAEQAQKLAQEFPHLELTILNKDDMEKLGMRALLAVARGSKNEPYMPIITYRGNPNSSEMLALVGKGVTFDSGGISIKPSDKMWEMRGDMAGSATVLAAIKSIAQLQPSCNVMAILPCVENMPSGSAYRPGDIITAMNGKTIEIYSTDAEGRMILADAVHYAEQLGATKIVDVATLTGACAIAVGDLYAATITNSAEFYQYLVRASEKTGEKIWQLPAEPLYKKLIQSDFADLKNSGGRAAGTITGGLFIGEFVTKDWIHIDIASTSDTDKTSGYQLKGATGYGVRLLVQLTQELSSC